MLSAVEVGVSRTTPSSLAAPVIAEVQLEVTEPMISPTFCATSELNALSVSDGSPRSSRLMTLIC